MEPFWTEDMVYDFAYVGEWNFAPTRGLWAWFNGEHMHYNTALPDCQFVDFIRAATHNMVTSASYGLAQWKGDFAGVPAPANHPWVHIRDLDFYLLDGDRIKYNWCIVDVVDLLIQGGYDVLPPAPMKTRSHGYLPQTAADGIPAPYSAMVLPNDTVSSTTVWLEAIHEDYLAMDGTASRWADDMIWYGPAGIGTAFSRDDYVNHYLKPLRNAFSNVTLEMDSVVCEGKYCGAHFYLWGDHTGPWLGEGATGARVPIRCGAHARIVDGKIVEGWLIVDIPRAFIAMGVDLYGRAKVIAAAQTAA